VRESGVLDTLWGKGLIGTFVTLLCVICYALLIRIPKEDETLREVFGKEWDDYAYRVPYVLVPGLI